VARAFYEEMLTQEYGKVVCIGSFSGKRGGAGVRPAYAAAKSGIHGFVRDVAQHGGPHGVYVNAIAPALVRTPMTESDEQGEHPQRPEGSSSFPPDYSPLGRVGVPEDVAECVVFLASQQSNWVTGSVLEIDGGHTLES
jgi:NAD(P)-dependent dehydrogenase (short-subunit alcohol dehydrogenase family)